MSKIQTKLEKDPEMTFAKAYAQGFLAGGNLAVKGLRGAIEPLLEEIQGDLAMDLDEVMEILETLPEDATSQ